MNTLYRICALLAAVTCVHSIQPTENTKEVKTTWRRPHFAHTNVEMNRNCNDICRRRGQDWTTNWSHIWWQGQQCECKNRPKVSWVLFGKREPTPADIEYRPAGAISNSHELQDACTRQCEDHAEQYTGQWEYKTLRGYLCKCKKST